MPLISVDVDEAEPLLREGLGSIMQETGERIDVDHVLRQLKTQGSPYLFTDESLTGFVVLGVHTSFNRPEQSLYVLSAYKRGGDGMAEYDSEIEDIAGQIGAEHVLFKTRRSSLVRLSKRHGYEMNAYELSKEVR